MGLDISYSAGITRLRDRSDDGEYDYDNENSIYVNPEFPAQADNLTTGIYTPGIDGGSFRAGSYRGYNSWRDMLAAMAGYGSDEAAWQQGDKGRTEGPFWELINFSDCEGVIGPITSAKLAKDFEAFQVAADAHADDWFKAQYARWRKAFETAARDGAVEFH